MKRLMALLLAAILLLSVLPLVSAETKTDEPADIWDTIRQIENEAAPTATKNKENALAEAYAGCVDRIVAAVEASDSYVPDSLFRKGDNVFWQTKDGVANGYSPSLRAKLHTSHIAGADPEAFSKTETFSYADKGYPGSLNVAVFQPFYGLDSNFGTSYPEQGKSIAAVTGGTCTVYKTTNATIDNIAKALQTCGVVMMDSHGTTDANEDVEDAVTSYIVLTCGTGITSTDYAPDYVNWCYHAYDAGTGDDGISYYLVDGTAIANHMSADSSNTLFWNGVCLGMATDGISEPLRSKGVEVVYGYSRSVTFTGDLDYQEAFFAKIKQGNSVKDAIAYMKNQVGVHDPYKSSSSYPAYPIVVSDEDAYPGHGNVDAQQTVKSTWRPLIKPAVTGNPSAVTVKDGQTATFTVSASGTDLKYQWQYSADGGKTWANCTANSSNKRSFSFFASMGFNGRYFRCRVSNASGTVYSTGAKLTVTASEPTIRTSPSSAKAEEGCTATFKVVAAGTDPKYQWQYKRSGGTSWANWSGKTEATLVVTAGSNNNGCQYRCVVSNSLGKVASDAATLTVVPKTKITTQPSNASAALGKTVTFKVVASGTGLTYQWQYQRAGETTWKNWSGKTSATLTVTAGSNNNGCQYRCVVKGVSSTVASNAALLTITDMAPVIVTQPSNATVVFDKTATFKVVAAGAGLTYQWQYKRAGMTAWTDWSGKTAATLNVTAGSNNNGCQYRCVVKNSYGTVASNAATLTVASKPAITTQPSNASAALGKTVTFKVSATGNALSYQWQYLRAGETAWMNWSGKTSATLSVTAGSGNNGCRYRCVVKNIAGYTVSNPAQLTITNAAPAIQTHPANATAASGKTATFKVVAVGTDLSYQWQYKRAGATSWLDWSGKTAATLTVTAGSNNNGCQYRCVVKNSCGTAISNAAALTVQ